MKKMFKDKTILITGGTGFLGRALVRRLLKYNPHAIRIFSRDEVKHYKLKEMIPDPNNKLRFLVGDVRDYERVNKAVKGCDIVIHAAAMKRIDMIEYNVSESIKTNVLGTLNVIGACIENNVEKAIYVSSDKACSPINTYGACKFIGERIFTESNFSKGKSKTIFACVRYGNVLNSTGSLIPMIYERIKNKKDIQLTDPKMTRFFISEEEAVNLIFEAIRLGNGGEVFVPKLNSFKIIDLMKIIREKYNSSSRIKITGVRPGEKLHELIINESESPRTIKFNNFFIITSQIEKYQDKVYDYLKKTKKVDFKEYSSENSIADIDVIKKPLYNILNKI